MWRPDRRGADRITMRYWDGLVAGAPAEELARLGESMDPNLRATLNRIGAARLRHRPNPAFVARLEGELMDAMAVIRPPVVAGVRIEPRNKRSWKQLLLLATALALVALAGLLVYLALGGSNDHPSQQQPALTVASPTAATAPVDTGVPRATSRGNPERTGEFAGPSVDAKPVGVRWTYSTSGGNFSWPTELNGMIFVSDDGGALHALDEATGHRRWTKTIGTSVFSAPAVYGDVVIVCTEDGKALAFDRLSGDQRWMVQMGGPSEVGVTLGPDGTAYFGGADTIVYAVDAQTGKTRWTLKTTSEIRTVSVGGGMLFAGSIDGILHGIDASTGAKRWEFHDQSGERIRSPAYADGIVYGAETATTTFALDAATGKELWRYVAKNIPQPVTVAGGIVYVESDDGVLIALDANTGAQRWQVAIAGPVSSPPVVAAGELCAQSGNAEVICYDAATGVERWRLATPGILQGPTIFNGRLYTTDGQTLYAWANAGDKVMAAASAVATPVVQSAPYDVVWSATGTPDQIPMYYTMNVAPNGEIYVSDGLRDRFRIYAPDGTFLLDWGGTGSGDGQFNLHNAFNNGGAVAFDDAGDIYVADMLNHRVQKFDAARHFLAAWPLGVNSAGQAVEPFAIEVVGGFVYVFDNSALGQRVLVYDLDGQFKFDFGSPGAGPGQFSGSGGFILTHGPDGTLYAIDGGNFRVQAFTGDGDFLREWKNPPLSTGIPVLPTSFVALADGSVLIVDANGRLSHLSVDGKLLGNIQIDSGLFVGLPDGAYLIVSDQLTKIRLRDSSL